VVTESYFSMDGTSPDLRALRSLCDEAGAGLIVDEAHALGVFGDAGAGLCAARGVCADALVGTLSKAVGAQGGFVAGSPALLDTLWNRARSFVFSTGFAPHLAHQVLHRIRTVQRATDRRTRLSSLERAFARHLPTHLAGPPGRHGPIFPIPTGSNHTALALARALRTRGFRGHAIRPPTVPDGTARVRISLNAALTEADVERLADALIALCPA
jgi:7-keto-8-aminopelargonate synthetase-like enzyme